MPLNAYPKAHFSTYYQGYAKPNDRTLKQVPSGNFISNIPSNYCSNRQKNLPHSNLYTASNYTSNSKPKIRILSTKTISGKLFSKAKLISDSKRETFLSPSSSQTDRSSSNETKIKTIRFLRVSKTKGQKPQNSKKAKSVGDSNIQNKVIQEYYIQPQNNYHTSNLNNNQFSIHKNTQSKFTLDYQQAQLIKKNNIFSSSSGQLLLENLVGQQVSKPNSNPGIKAQQSENMIKGSGKNYCLKIPKAISVEVADGVQIQKIQVKNSGQTSFFEQVKEEKKPVQGYVSSFSRLIMKDKLATLKSDELNISNTLDEQSIGELSLMSKH